MTRCISLWVYSAIALIGALMTSCSGKSPDPNQHLSAGSATIRATHASAFSKHSANMSGAERILRFNLGNDFFERAWVSQRASTQSRDGLGPLFNNNACQNCHIKDGRGHAPQVSQTDNGHDFSSTLIRTIRRDITPDQRQQMLNGTLAHVELNSTGAQIQHRANIGTSPEARLRVSYKTHTVTLGDGTSVELRQPLWHVIAHPNQKPLEQHAVLSVRVAQPMIGLGMLEAVNAEDILRHEDVTDENKDGISGKANQVWNSETNRVELGRFGWKAGQSTLRQQNAAAFVNDMGLTSALQPNDNCQDHQLDCINRPNGNGDQNDDYPFEVSNNIFNDIEFYSRNLAVPERRNAYSRDVLKGKALFKKIGCDGCHIESFKTSQHNIHLEQSEQVIYPYTDLLVHDMGDALA
ncbi:MAG: di-heme oxidoredictase family protein, partial [Pseudomonadota bacterium]